MANYALKAKYSFYSTLIFFLIANPETFKMTQSVFGFIVRIADPGGCPTATGFFIHTIVFFLVLWAAMLFPNDPPPSTKL
jgi:hypothetical protein